MNKIYIVSCIVYLATLFSCNTNKNVIKNDQSIIICEKIKISTSTVYNDFITASRNLDFEYLKNETLNDNQKKYINTLQLVMDRKTDEAEPFLFELVNDQTDLQISMESKMLLENLYLSESKWSEFLKIHPNPESLTDIYYTHSKAWSSLQPTYYNFPDKGIFVPLKFTKNGQPLVFVEINGKGYWFIIDTGAQFSMISRNVAKECDLQTIKTDEIASNSMFSIPGMISKIQINGAEIKNVPVMIVDSKNIDIKFLNIFTLMKIDGIIGWPQLKNFRVEIDHFNNLLKISKSNQSILSKSNFFYYFRPIIKIFSSNGTPLYCWFDTGSSTTSLFLRGADKTKKNIIKKGYSITSMQSIMGGTKIEHNKIIENENFCISNQLLSYNKIKIENIDNPFFDGWIGMDICKKGRLIFDFPNGEILLQNP